MLESHCCMKRGSRDFNAHVFSDISSELLTQIIEYVLSRSMPIQLQVLSGRKEHLRSLIPENNSLLCVSIAILLRYSKPNLTSGSARISLTC